jgi:hypothetical protein
MQDFMCEEACNISIRDVKRVTGIVITDLFRQLPLRFVVRRRIFSHFLCNARSPQGCQSLVETLCA